VIFYEDLLIAPPARLHLYFTSLLLSLFFWLNTRAAIHNTEKEYVPPNLLNGGGPTGSCVDQEPVCG
jgi:hypothetical protein